ncbi:MAG: hypothetical protein ACI8W9_001481 [Psychromonas sp.]
MLMPYTVTQYFQLMMILGNRYLMRLLQGLFIIRA